MKLIFAIVHKEDDRKVMEELTKKGFLITKLSSSGGFLRAGNTTLLIGVSTDKLEEALDIIRNNAKSRKQIINSSPQGGVIGAFVPMPLEIVVGGATVFVIGVEKYEKI